MSNTKKTGTEMIATLVMLGYDPAVAEGLTPDELRIVYTKEMNAKQEQERGGGSGLNADGGREEEEQGEPESEAPGTEAPGVEAPGVEAPGIEAPTPGDLPSPQAAMRGAPPRPNFGSKKQSQQGKSQQGKSQQGKSQQSQPQQGKMGSTGSKRLLTDEQINQAAARAASAMGQQVAAKLEASLKAAVDDINEKGGNAVEEATQELTNYIRKVMAEVEARTKREVTIHEPGQPPQKVEGQHEKFADLLFNAKMREPTMLVGPTGSGKTTASRQVAEVLGLPFDYLPFSPQQTKTDLTGYQSAVGDYVPSSFYLRYRYGGVMLFDELDAGHPGVSLWMNSAIQNRLASFPRGRLTSVEYNAAKAAGLNGEMKDWKVGETETGGLIEMHPDCVVIASANTYGKGGDGMYVGRQPIDTATFKRFAFITWDYDEPFEQQLAPLPEWTTLVQAVRRSVLSLKMLHAVSPVDSIRGGKLILAGKPWQTVAKETIFAGLKDDEIQRVLQHYPHNSDIEQATSSLELWSRRHWDQERGEHESN